MSFGTGKQGAKLRVGALRPGDTGVMAFEDCHEGQARHVPAEMPDIYTDIDERNGWREEGEVTDEERERMLVFAADSMREILTFCVPKPPRSFRDVVQVAMRFLCCVWLLRPELLGGETLSSLGRLFEGVSRAVTRSHLSQIASCASRRWHYHSRVQRTDTAREHHAEAARKSWPKRR